MLALAPAWSLPAEWRIKERNPASQRAGRVSPAIRCPGRFAIANADADGPVCKLRSGYIYVHMAGTEKDDGLAGLIARIRTG